MNADNRLCFFRDFLPDAGRIDFPCIGGTVRKNRHRSRIGHSPGRSDISIGRHNDLVAFADSQRHHRTVQRRSAVIDPGRIRNAAIPGKFFVEPVREFSAGKRGFFTDRAYCLHIFCLMFPIIPR